MIFEECTKVFSWISLIFLTFPNLSLRYPCLRDPSFVWRVFAAHSQGLESNNVTRTESGETYQGVQQFEQIGGSCSPRVQCTDARRQKQMVLRRDIGSIFYDHGRMEQIPLHHQTLFTNGFRDHSSW